AYGAFVAVMEFLVFYPCSIMSLSDAIRRCLWVIPILQLYIWPFLQRQAWSLIMAQWVVRIFPYTPSNLFSRLCLETRVAIPFFRHRNPPIPKQPSVYYAQVEHGVNWSEEILPCLPRCAVRSICLI